MEVVDGIHAELSQEGRLYVRRCWSTSQVRCEDTDDFWSHCLPGAQFLVGSNQNWSVILLRPYHGTPRDGSVLLSLQLVGCTLGCSTDAVVIVVKQATAPAV